MLPDRYELQNPIRHCLTTTDYCGMDKQTGRSVIIKVLNESYTADPKFVKRFQVEAQTASLNFFPKLYLACNFRSDVLYCLHEQAI